MGVLSYNWDMQRQLALSSKALTLETCIQFQCGGHSSGIQSIACGDTVLSQALKLLSTPTL